MELETNVKDQLVISCINGTTIYNRTTHPCLENLTEILRLKYGVQKCCLATSGMNAISTVLHSVFLKHKSQPIHCIIGNELFALTPKLFKSLSLLYANVTVVKVDITNKEKILSIAKQQNLENSTIVLFIESCTNPNGHVTDFNIIRILRSICKNIYIIVDNTWLTCEIFNPFDFGVDFVVLSLTKYYSGGKAICGAILGNDVPVINSVFEWQKINGIHISPYNCQIVSENIISLRQRIEKSSQLTLEIIKWLCFIGIAVNHPSLENHESFEKAKLYFRNGLYPSVFTFTIGYEKKAKVDSLLSTCPFIEYKTSFGAAKSRIDTHLKKTPTYRVSIGYDDNIDSLKRGFDYILKTL